ncbi:MAG: hypothetical protein LBS09_07850 [Bacteroidales bacterium]|jgi:hypothetical protein|nr:hypothetical protein [Bacteroidales bacterium]
MDQFGKGTFGYDVRFLRERDDALVILQDDGGDAQAAVSAKYQGKVFTSTAQGLGGKSFGWVNYRAFDRITSGAHINATGGENRFWIGPEGGQFSIFFKRGVNMVYDNWFTPAAFDTEPWIPTHAGKTSVRLCKDMLLHNRSGTQLSVRGDRQVTLLDNGQIRQKLGIDAVKTAKVAFETRNVITNTGATVWEKATGTVCIWILDMFTCGNGVTVIAPYRKADGRQAGKAATTDYFGEIPPQWLQMTEKAVFLKADGKKRAKIGLSPLRALPVAGSYDRENGVLTVVQYDVHPEAEYVNQQWKEQEHPYEGDAVNAYNDGPLADGSQMGPFYEIESSSPAAFLSPGASLEHKHTVFHFAGDETELDEIAQKVFHLSTNDIKRQFA